jgi:hypothetical protein
MNVRQRKLGTIIIQTVCIRQHESSVTDSLPERNSAVIPLYQQRRLLNQERRRRNLIGAVYTRDSGLQYNRGKIIKKYCISTVLSKSRKRE